MIHRLYSLIDHRKNKPSNDYRYVFSLQQYLNSQIKRATPFLKGEIADK